jgi:hypothetical protein
MEWAVLDWNAPAIGFYERLGARLRKDWILTRLTGEDLRRLGSIDRRNRTDSTSGPGERPLSQRRR